MVYTIPEMMSGQWLEGKILTRNNYNDKFIEQFAEMIADIHGIVTQSSRTPKMQGIISGLEQCDDFTKEAILEYYEIQSNLQHTAYLHGDLHGENVIVNGQGNLVGLIDWEHAEVGDPHWDFRLIRRWIGWPGLERLLFYYNTITGLQCKIKYIEILDKISLCNSRQIRTHPVSIFNEYIRVWPSPLKHTG
jgi:thiamine kinase-like enzyme